MSNSLHRFLFTVCAALFVLPSFEGASLFKVLLFNGLVCGSTLRSAADDRSTERFEKKLSLEDGHAAFSTDASVPYNKIPNFFTFRKITSG